MVDCAASAAEVELEDRCFLRVIPVKEREKQAEWVRGSQQVMIHIWHLWDNRQKEAELSRSPSDCGVDLTVQAHPMGEHPAKGSTQGRNSQALMPLLCSPPCWGLPPQGERSWHGTVANLKSSALDTQLTVLFMAEVQVDSWWETQAAHLHSYVTGTKLLCRFIVLIYFFNVLKIFIKLFRK